MNTPLLTSTGLYAENKQREDALAGLRSLWTALVPIELPSNYQLHLWLSRYPLDLVKFAFEATGNKAQRMQRDNLTMDADHSLRYCSSVMRNESERRCEKANRG